jgi:glycosyltransferase involved in cell wall biosynthesis
LKVALVHDWLNQMGGAEGVLEELVRIFPEAPIYTSIYWREKMPAAYQAWDIRTSFLDRWPLVKRHHQLFLPMYPLAFESLDLRGYDVVITNKSGFCHGVITPAGTLHICYCLTPTRYLWNTREYLEREQAGRAARAVLAPFLQYLRLWDRLAADRVDRFVAISREVQQRIARVYRRPSDIIYPPVHTERFRPAEGPHDYYLIASRLIPYKRIDLAVQAFNQLDRPLVIAGDGRDRRRLEAMAGPNVRFLGRVSDEELAKLMAGCRAFIFPGLEDFGIAPVEALAAGRPVIAYAGGGALDTVIDGLTGVLFYEQNPAALAEAVRRLEALGEDHFDPLELRRQAERFSAERFRQEFRAYVERAYTEHAASLPAPQRA